MFMVMDRTNQALSKVQSTVYVFYEYSFNQGNKGYGAAIVMILVVFIMIVTVIMQRAEKRFVFYN
jgi:multiple sugar transport system permease protein